MLETPPSKTKESYDRHDITIFGEPINLPKDLYIPKNALQIFLETFTGPLDLLLYLIKKQNINILDIPIAKITAQYLEYIELKKQIQLELAAEYLVMAAVLAEIKSKMLLPKSTINENEEKDPRLELVLKLQEYERFKKIAQTFEILPRLERDFFIADVDLPAQSHIEIPLPEVTLNALTLAYQKVLKRAKLFEHHYIKKEPITLHERITEILQKLVENKILIFQKLFNISEGKFGVVVTFIAILELLKQEMIDVVQTETTGAIYVKNKE